MPSSSRQYEGIPGTSTPRCRLKLRVQHAQGTFIIIIAAKAGFSPLSLEVSQLVAASPEVRPGQCIFLVSGWWLVVGITPPDVPQ